MTRMVAAIVTHPKTVGKWMEWSFISVMLPISIVGLESDSVFGDTLGADLELHIVLTSLVCE